VRRKVNMYNKDMVCSELWAVMTLTGKICFSRGGSSSTPKLMVYDSESKAKRAIKSPWIKQVINVDSIKIKRIYKTP
jgi:hypothetical protein